MMRSFLFVPGDSTRKFEKAVDSGADALILDLEDSVAAAAKHTARNIVAEMLKASRGSQARFVRVNALDTSLTLRDLKSVMPHAPDGIVLPKCEGPDDLRKFAHYLAAFEAAHDLGETKILAIVTETAASLFTLGRYRDVDPRLWGIMWGAGRASALARCFSPTLCSAHMRARRQSTYRCWWWMRSMSAPPPSMKAMDLSMYAIEKMLKP